MFKALSLRKYASFMLITCLILLSIVDLSSARAPERAAEVGEEGIVARSPVPATTKKSSTTKKSTTKKTTTTTSKSSSSTSTTSTTKSSSSTTSTTSTTKSSSSSSTSKSKTLTWKSITAARPNCPTYAPTDSLLPQTATTSNGAAATMYLDLFGGKIPQQITTQNSDNDTLVFKATNASQVTAFNPGKYVTIIDDGGISIFDEQCQTGAKLYIPGFFNVTEPSKESFKAHYLDPRDSGTAPFNIYLTLTDECNKPAKDTVSNALAYFDPVELPFRFPGQTSITNYGSGKWGIRIVGPYVHSDACEQTFDSIKDFFSDPTNKAIKGYADIAKRLGQYGIVAAPAVTALLEGLGVGVLAAFAGEALFAYGLASAFVNIGALDYIKDETCTKSLLSYTLTVDTTNQPGLSVDSQSSPFQSKSLSFTIPKPKDQQCDGCPDFQNDPKNCGTCKNVCPGNKICSGGSCSCPYGASQDCGDHCADTSSDSNNCGSCGHACAANERCVSGTCKAGCSPVFDCRGGGNGVANGGGCTCYDWDGSLTLGQSGVDSLCSDLQTCGSSAGCASGSFCSLDSCCGYGVCIPNCGGGGARRLFSSRPSKHKGKGKTTRSKEL